MPRFQRGLGLRPVNSIKHIVDLASSAVTSVVTVLPVIDASDTPTLGNPESVAVGSTVNAIFLRVEVLAQGAFVTVPRIYMTVQKNPGNNLTTTNPNSVGTSDNKKHVIHQEMIMVGDSTESRIPRTMFLGVIRIPPRLKRFGHDDRLQISFQHDAGETSAVTNVCVQVIYKEFR